MNKHIYAADISGFEKQYRTNLINGLGGIKSALLVGTQGKNGENNLAIFSQIVHIGANPALMGILHRPVSVEKHTYENIVSNEYFTLNHIPVEKYKEAHQSSARYERNQSEFEECGFEPEFTAQVKAPYVKDSMLKIGLKLVEIIPVKSNDTLLIVGSVEEIIVAEEILEEAGYIDLSKVKTSLVHGLETYYQAEKIGRLPYAKPINK
jgi:flavin reductase (DIM6/NTAB) family NADH-FMN oxidoreductase RutF